MSELPGPNASEATPVQFESRDGTQLVGSFYPAANAKGNALILHGYAEHGGRYGEVAATLNDAGLNALSFDFRGHGRSQGDRGYIRKIDDYLADVAAAMTELKRLGGDGNVLLVGHSNGGLVALRLLADPFLCPKDIVGAVISSPFLKLKDHVPVRSALAKFASLVLPKLALPNQLESNKLTHDPEKIKEHERDPLCHDVASARWFSETLHAQAWVHEFAHRIEVPTLWVVAGMDHIVDPEQTKQVHGKLKSESAYHEFPDMHHEVFNEIDRSRVFDLVSAFVSQTFSS